MKLALALFLASMLAGCSASRAEKDQQDFFEVEAYARLKPSMTEAQILSWAGSHKLGRASDGSTDIILLAPGIDTRWPHIPCARTFTQIRITLDGQRRLASYRLGRGGVCL